MTNLEYLEQRRDAVCRQIGELSRLNYDLPNASGPAGIDYTGKIRALYDELNALNMQISTAEGPYEVVSEAYAE